MELFFPCFADPYLYEIIPNSGLWYAYNFLEQYAIVVRYAILIIIAIPVHITIFEFACVYNPTAQLNEFFPYLDIYG